MPPQANQIEISVFGPGYGESIVIHTGEGIWFVIDCCNDKSKGQPKPIQYLNSLGVNITEDVKLIVATHWHDDHVAGLSTMLEACNSAVFCCPVSLSSKEFLSLSELYKDAPISYKSGAHELGKSIEIAANRSKLEKKTMLKLIKADSKVYELHKPKVTVYALSPSDEMVRRCNEFMVTSYAIATSKVNNLQRIVSNTPNDNATALRINIGGRSILLGSDVEEQGNPLVGWSSILVSHTDKAIYSTFKVAHHGSRSGHHDDVWSLMLTKNPLSFLTPFKLGRHKIPTAMDRARVKGLTNRAYITANPNIEVRPKTKRNSKVEALINIAAKNRQLAIGQVGHIRWRASIDDENDQGVVELFDGAQELTKIQ